MYFSSIEVEEQSTKSSQKTRTFISFACLQPQQLQLYILQFFNQKEIMISRPGASCATKSFSLNFIATIGVHVCLCTSEWKIRFGASRPTKRFLNSRRKSENPEEMDIDTYGKQTSELFPGPWSCEATLCHPLAASNRWNYIDIFIPIFEILHICVDWVLNTEKLVNIKVHFSHFHNSLKPNY